MSPLLLSLVTLVVVGAALPSTDPETESIHLLHFDEPSDVDAWRPVHDGVMGGVSTGSAELVEGAARFAGEVSLENNGGFASFRLETRLPDLSGYRGLRLRVLGDGQIYKVSLRTEAAWDGVSWQAPFETVAGEWTTVEIAFQDLEPTWRGSRVPNAGALDRSAIRQLGIVIAQEGPFALQLEKVEAWRAPALATPDPD